MLGQHRSAQHGLSGVHSAYASHGPGVRMFLLPQHVHRTSAGIVMLQLPSPGLQSVSEVGNRYSKLQ